MKTSKMNFASMKSALSRAELKKIMAGSTGTGGGGTGGGGGSGCVSTGGICGMCCPGVQCMNFGGGNMGCAA